MVHVQVILSNSLLCGQNNLIVPLFLLTREAANEVSFIRCYNKQLYIYIYKASYIAILLSYQMTPCYPVLSNTWFWCWCVQYDEHLWKGRRNLQSWMKKKKVPFFPSRNCRFNSAAATSNPQSQQMISLVCIAYSPTHIHGQHKGRRRLRLTSGIGNPPNRIWGCCWTEANMNCKWYRDAVWNSTKAGGKRGATYKSAGHFTAHLL